MTVSTTPRESAGQLALQTQPPLVIPHDSLASGIKLSAYFTGYGIQQLLLSVNLVLQLEQTVMRQSLYQLLDQLSVSRTGRPL